LTLLRIENVARVPSVDEALALAHLLEDAPAHLLSPSGGDVWLTDNFGIDGAGMRNFLVFGDPLLLTPPGRRASLRIRLVHALEVHAQALVDAKRGGDRAGVQTAAKAISDLLGEHRDQIGDIEEEPEEETT